MKLKKGLWFSQLFSVNYVIDTSNIVLWVSVCVRDMQDFALAGF